VEGGILIEECLYKLKYSIVYVNTTLFSLIEYMYLNKIVNDNVSLYLKIRSV